MSSEASDVPTSTLSVPVNGGQLLVTRFGSGPHTVLGIHGITANAMSLRPVARHLGPAFTLLAPDLRGRGGSVALPAPYGLSAHAADCAAVLHAAGSAPVVVLGESMGAYVAVALAAEHPMLVRRLVLADGGLPLPLPPGLIPGTDPNVVADMVLGPALTRLKQVFPSVPAYLAFWRQHPAFQRNWNPDIEAYFEYDLGPVEGGFQSRVSEAAVRIDAAEQLTRAQALGEALAAVACAIDLVRAPRNLMNQPLPLLSDAVVREWTARLPGLTVEMAEDENHYSLMMGGRGAGLLAARVAGR